MNHRTRLLAAAGGTVVLFLCVQLGALALLDPYVAADAQPVEDPSNPGNVAFFFGVILVATAAMLAAIKFDLEEVIRAFVVLSCGWITWLVLSTLATSVAGPARDAGAGGGLSGWALFLGPVLGGLLLVLALFVRPEWYVIDAAGVLLGAGAAGLFGLAFTPEITILFLVVLAVYDAISVYGTEHMLTLAEGVSDLNLPVLLVVPAVGGFSLLADDGPGTIGNDAETAGDGGTTARDGADGTAADPATDSDSAPENHDDDRRDAIYIGLGDAVMPTILVVSAARWLRESAPLYDVPLLAVNLPALGALVGTLVGLLGLLWLVLRGRPQAGLPLLNGGAIAGYLLGAVASGITVVEALGLPL